MKHRKLLISIFSLLLAAALLTGCALSPAAPSPDPTPKPMQDGEPTAKPAPTPAAHEDAIVVKSVDELLEALAPHAVIRIDAEHIRLDDAADYGFGYSDGPYTWERMDQGQYELVIRSLEGLTICGRGMGETKLTTRSAFSDVLSFRGCADLTLEDLTFGHRTPQGGCDGDVISLTGCDEVQLSRCELFGCGVIGLDAYSCSRVYLDDCLLRDCSMAALNVTACTDFQARGCEIARCGSASPLGLLCAASCEGFALINCTIHEGENTFLLDAMNSRSVCLLGTQVSGARFSNALFRLYDHNITVSGCALADNQFGACYMGGAWVAETGAGDELLTFRDFERMEYKPFRGEYVGPDPRPAVTPAAVPAPGESQEIHVKDVDELLAAIAPRTTVYLDGEEFNLTGAAAYGGRESTYYTWEQEYDGYTLVLRDLEDFSLVGQGLNITLLCTQPRYADVLRFENCSRIALTQITMGHTPEPGICTGDVLNVRWCEDVSVSHCGFFGCGEVGISAENSSKLLVTDSNIYDCSSYGAQLENVNDMSFSDCSITNCGSEYYGVNGIHSYNCSNLFYDNERLYDGDFVPAAKG